MRADRLLSFLMLLETHGKMTAVQLASDLEVSQRTIYRDIVALNSAGIPIYTESGPNGGVSLIESYHTDLTGLSIEEVQALSMLGIPKPLVELGFGQKLQAALLKLSAAFPSISRSTEARAKQRIHLDSCWWFQSEQPAPFLQVIYQALWQDNKLHLVYRSQFDAKIETIFPPYGLVAKAGIWYLVGSINNRVIVLQLSRIIEAYILEERFNRPVDFDLSRFWKSWSEDFEKNRPCYPVIVRISPELSTRLPQIFAEHVEGNIVRLSPPENDGWITATLHFENLWTARSRILSLGNAIEVLEPLPLRLSVLDYASQIVKFYHDKGVRL